MRESMRARESRGDGEGIRVGGAVASISAGASHYLLSIFGLSGFRIPSSTAYPSGWPDSGGIPYHFARSMPVCSRGFHEVSKPVMLNGKPISLLLVRTRLCRPSQLSRSVKLASTSYSSGPQLNRNWIGN